jgi:hypothetical protein
MPSGGEELPFDRGVTIQQVGSVRKSTDFLGACRCESPEQVPTSEAARRAARFLPVAAPVVPGDPSTSAGARARQLAPSQRAARFDILLRRNGRIHRDLNRYLADSPTQSRHDRRYARAVRTGRRSCNRSVKSGGAWRGHSGRWTSRRASPQDQAGSSPSCSRAFPRSAARVARDAR